MIAIVSRGEVLRSTAKKFIGRDLVADVGSSILEVQVLLR